MPRRDVLRGGGAIAPRYRAFRPGLPAILENMGLDEDEMVFADNANIASTWLLERSRARR